ncbi:ribosome assembly cofactor RimP [Mycoplasma tauri]|uniref:ribosome assembly cofactor RimP n=1 Tax=Mycoplasma tauri TaxID=547987 RepID=UPI001CC11848|nr:ribosome assembly cofactor RimP [Mycoplasma tauri]MBZ4203348.1 ribosome assembly cofactor RimP [Mycoplasma tauri]
MDWRKTLINEFCDQIIDVKFLNENSMKLLDVTVSHTDIQSINELTNEINSYVDGLNVELEFEAISIHSPGFDSNYKIDELESHIGEVLDVKLIKNVDKKDFYTGELLEVSESSILLRWNCKGQFRKVNILKENISSINANFESMVKNKSEDL